MAIKIKVLKHPELTWFEKLYIPQILSGLLITIKHLIRFKPITVQYPEEVKELPEPEEEDIDISWIELDVNREFKHIIKELAENLSHFDDNILKVL